MQQVDDEVLTGGSIANAAQLVRDNGAQDVYLAFTHPVLAPGGVQKLAEIGLKEIVTTNTLPMPAEKQLPNMKVLSIAPLLAAVILRANQGRSVGELFNE